MGYSKCEGRLLTRYSPVRHSTKVPKNPFAFDLHVLSTPPAFVLSQDQTLQFDILYRLSLTGPYAKKTRLSLNYKDAHCVKLTHVGPFAVSCYSVVKDRAAGRPKLCRAPAKWREKTFNLMYPASSVNTKFCLAASSLRAASRTVARRRTAANYLITQALSIRFRQEQFENCSGGFWLVAIWPITCHKTG